MTDFDIPKLGFGTARLRGDPGKLAIRGAIATGFRHFDTAKVYGNEKLLGNELNKALQDGYIHRKELFITSKLWNDDHRPENVEKACRGSLERLGLDYLDLYLIHWPCHWRKGTLGCPDYNVDMIDTWKAMETLVKNGFVKYIGVSNFSPKLLSKILQKCQIRPVCNQIEIHPRFQQSEIVQFCQQENIVVTAWSPLAKGGIDLDISTNENSATILKNAALKRNISSSELILLWHLSRNIVAIPRSSNIIHIRDNLNILKRVSADHKTTEKTNKKEEENHLNLLSQEELDAFASLDQGRRLTFDFVGAFEETQFPWTLVGKNLYFIARIIWTFLPHRLDFKMPS